MGSSHCILVNRGISAESVLFVHDEMIAISQLNYFAKPSVRLTYSWEIRSQTGPIVFPSSEFLSTLLFIWPL